ncbi:MAG: hypothetical protein GXX84_19360 [Acidobacteria bacterium]|nr:hypothetical protein [Acidobacteriota bacterium]
MKNRLNNRLGLGGWLGGGRYGVDRYAYAFHRLTGLGILAYFIMHIFVTGMRVGGQEEWERTMAFFNAPVFKAGEFLVFLAFIFHAVNGIRLVIVELACGIGRPHVPAYPYTNSTMRQRPFVVAVMILAALLMITGGVDFYFMLN